jgi:transcriptional activator SPT7
MDLGTMTKKLKQLAYKSKTDFVADLNLIWDNCLKYNQDMNHPLRRMANGMRKEAEKLIPLIPDLAIRSRAEVEAEERRKQNGGEDEGGDDSDDEPIMSSRGRTAGTKGAKSRKAPTDEKEDTPVVDQKPILQVNGLLAKSGREGSEVGEGSNGFATPPIGGSITPSMPNGQSGVGSNAEAMDVDGPTLNHLALNQAFGEAAEQVFEHEDYKIWKQQTKKDRALVAKERCLMFKDNVLNADAPALLRSKADMRRILRHRKEAADLGLMPHSHADGPGSSSKEVEDKPSETLADGIEDDIERRIPDYYLPTSNIPDIQPDLQWIEDGVGQVVNQHGEFLKLVPAGSFTAPKSSLVKKMDENIRQIQLTRRLASKISLIKQIQLQTQVCKISAPVAQNEV